MKIIVPLVQFQQQLRIFHWQTESYAQHKALGKAYEGLDGLIDSFVETFMGKYGRLKSSEGNYTLELVNLDSGDITKVIDEFIEYLDTYEKELEESDTDLFNIRDEIKGTCNTLKYLLTLK